MTFEQCLRELRLKAATRYLGERKLSVRQTADLLGYSDATAFARAFKRWTGFSPRRYTQRHGIAPSIGTTSCRRHRVRRDVRHVHLPAWLVVVRGAAGLRADQGPLATSGAVLYNCPTIMASATLPLIGPLTRATTPERVAALLTQAILDGAISPGTQLVEVDVAAQFGVSRHTVREAFRLAGREGFVEHAPFRGVSVRAFTAAEVADIYRARRLFEAEGVRMLPTASADALNAIAAHAAAFDAAVLAERWTAAFAADMALHAGIVGLIGSPRVSTMMHDLLLSLRVAQYVLPAADEDAFRRSRGQHREIVRAFRSGNRVRAAAAVQRHLEDAERALCDALRQLDAGAAVPAARTASADGPGGASR